MPPLSETSRFRFVEIGRYLAHVNTLSAGSIVVIATFAQKFHGQGPGWLLAVSVAGFAAAIAAGVGASISTLALMQDNLRPDDPAANWAAGLFAASAVLFGAALACLATFACIAVT